MCIRDRPKAGHLRHERLLHGAGLAGGVLDGSHNEVRKGLGVGVFEGFGRDRQRIEFTGSSNRGANKATSSGALEIALRELVLGRFKLVLDRLSLREQGTYVKSPEVESSSGHSVSRVWPLVLAGGAVSSSTVAVGNDEILG